MGGYENFETVLVAAGLSTRMGETNKLLIEVDGQALIRRTASLYCALGMQVTIVLGHQGEAIKEALAGLPVRTVFNADYKTGQQSSVRAGLDASDFSKTGILIALADQPLLTPADIAGLCDAFLSGSPRRIMVPYVNQTRGNPVLFPSALAKLAHAEGEGSVPDYRRFIDANPALVSSYAAPNANFITDIDSPEDAEKYLKHFSLNSDK